MCRNTQNSLSEWLTGLLSIIKIVKKGFVGLPSVKQIQILLREMVAEYIFPVAAGIFDVIIRIGQQHYGGTRSDVMIAFEIFRFLIIGQAQ